jgi:hypothetical protein
VTPITGSLYNPAEVFPYYSLPFCAPKEAVHHGGSLGDAFAGDRKQSSLYDIRFKVDIQWQSLCAFRLTQDDIKLFVDAIKRDYVYEIYVDGLQVQGFIGALTQHVKRVDAHVHNETRMHLFTHLDFTLAHNGDRVRSRAAGGGRMSKYCLCVSRFDCCAGGCLL